MRDLQNTIDQAWEDRASLSPSSAPAAVRDAVESVIAGLDAGTLRVCEKTGGAWITHQWVKKAVLISFRLADNHVMTGGATQYYDKVDSKFASYDAARFAAGGFRVVPPAIARRGAFVAKNVVLM
ncbi:unnamed protein product, partial [Phaeothamnion confervicola]